MVMDIVSMATFIMAGAGRVIRPEVCVEIASATIKYPTSDVAATRVFLCFFWKSGLTPEGGVVWFNFR